jgi:hypothetical protein
LEIVSLQGEGDVTPHEGESAPHGSWERGIGNGYPFDLGGFFDQGDWVFSEDIQRWDPPVLFYNLFACGPGRFTDENYLAGAYIFNTTYGLITIASAKSGSMLKFEDFTRPLSQRKSFGGAFLEWFDAQAPYQLWEKEWYYGMVLCGDPTLTLLESNKAVEVAITNPDEGFYWDDKKILDLPWAVVIVGGITITAEIIHNVSGVDRVEFYIDDELKASVNVGPYVWLWEEKGFGRKKVAVVAYDDEGHCDRDELIVWKIF